jgi:hypothetical protein
MVYGMITTFPPIPSGSIPAKTILRSVSIPGPGYRIETLVNQCAPEEDAGSAAEPQQLVLLPPADQFPAGQLDPMQSTLACWLKEQMR